MILRERFKCLLKNLKYIKQERGAVFVLTAILLPVLIGCLGIGYDVGNVYMHKARLQNATDAAALAAGEVFKNPPADDPQYTDLLKGKQIQLLNNHQAADRVAGEYIQKNEVNLGNPITIVERSALGYKDPSTQSGNTTTAKTTIFYRVIATEEVPLHFLPVILGMQNSPQKVKATSVARIETTTNTTQTGGGGTPTPVPNPSIFDNLYTYSEYFDAGLSNANNNIKSTFEGNMVFTYGNGSSTQEHFFDMDWTLANSGTSVELHQRSVEHLFDDSHANPQPMKENSSNAHWDKVNDPIIDTFYNTTAYVDAFRKKLNQPHYEFSDPNNITIGADRISNSQCNLRFTNSKKEGTYRKSGDNYYLLDSEGNDATFEENGKTYKILFRKMNDKYVLCGKNDEDADYYLLNNNGKISNARIDVVDHGGWTEEIPKLDEMYLAYWDTYYYSTDRYNGYTPVPVSRFKDGIALPTPVTSGDFSQIGSTENVYTNIYHIDRMLFQNNTVHNLVVNFSDALSGTDSDPVYVIVEENVDGSIQLNGGNNTRPLIFVYLGESNIKLNVTGTAKLTIYAPYGTVGVNPDGDPIHITGTFYGNIISKRIAIHADSSGEWHMQNFLQNDEDVTEATKKMLDAVDAKTVPAEVKQAAKQRYAAALGVNVSDMANDPLFYSKLGFYQKQALYAEWKKLITEEPYSNYKNMLWPWNDHFDLIIGDDGQPTTTVDSKSVIRIINPHLEDNPYFSSDSKI